MHSDVSDTQLAQWLERIALGDAQALRALFDASSQRLMAVAMRVLANRGLAEDAVQDAYLTIWRIAGDYRLQLSPPMVWLSLIARSRALDLARRRKAERALASEGAEGVDQLQALCDDADLEDLQSDTELIAALRRCLRRVEVKQREALVLAYFRDLSHTEVAAELQVPLGTAKTWLRRSLDKLRICLQDPEQSKSS